MKPQGSLPLIPVLSQTNPTHIITAYISKINTNILLSHASRFSNGHFVMIFPPKSYKHLSYKHFYYAICATFLAHFMLLDLIVCEFVKSTSYEILRYAVFSNIRITLGPNAPLSTYSQTLSLFVPLLLI
jgi:hypothetical protein